MEDKGMTDMEDPSAPMGMQMVFFSSSTTPLFTNTLTPGSTGAYAGLCVFLVLLAIITRSLLAVRSILEQRQLDLDYKRRYLVVQDRTADAQNILDNDQAKEATLITTHGSEEIRVVVAPARPVTVWRFSVDPPRALLTTVIAGLGYLLMLAVMSFNVGYFFSVLAGIFIGDVAVGRFTTGGGDH